MLRTLLLRFVALGPLALLACSPARPASAPSPPDPPAPLPSPARTLDQPPALAIHVLVPALEPRVKKTLEFRPAFGCSKDAFDIVVPVLGAKWGETLTLQVDAPASLTGTVETFAGPAAVGQERFVTAARSGGDRACQAADAVTRLLPYQAFEPDLARATTLAKVSYAVDGSDRSHLPPAGTTIRFHVVPTGVLDLRRSVFVVKQTADDPDVEDAVWAAYLGSGGGAAWERLEVARCAAQTAPDAFCEREGMSFAEVVRQRDYRRCEELFVVHRLDARCQKEGWQDASMIVAVVQPPPAAPVQALQPPPTQPVPPPPPVAVHAPAVVAPAPPTGQPPPPPPIVEQIPPPPQVDVDWTPGAWAWVGGQWSWLAGGYHPRRRVDSPAQPVIVQQPSATRPAPPLEPRKPGPERKATHK